MKTEIAVEFTIHGSFDPQEISKRLNLSSDREWRKGDPVRNTGREQECDFWSYMIPPKETLFADIQAESLLNIFSGKIDILKEIQKENEVSFGICFIVGIRNNEVPSIFFDRNFLEFNERIKSVIDIDMYMI